MPIEPEKVWESLSAAVRGKVVDDLAAVLRELSHERACHSGSFEASGGRLCPPVDDPSGGEQPRESSTAYPCANAPTISDGAKLMWTSLMRISGSAAPRRLAEKASRNLSGASPLARSGWFCRSTSPDWRATALIGIRCSMFVATVRASSPIGTASMIRARRTGVSYSVSKALSPNSNFTPSAVV